MVYFKTLSFSRYPVGEFVRLLKPG